MSTIFMRNKSINARMLDKSRIEINTSLNDTYHQSHVTLELTLPRGKIVSAKGQMDRSIHPFCSRIIDKLPESKGWSIHSGIISQSNSLFGGSHGCKKIKDLFLECCRTYSLAVQEYVRGIFPFDDFSDRERIQGSLAAQPNLRNSCAVYSEGSPYLKGVNWDEVYESHPFFQKRAFEYFLKPISQKKIDEQTQLSFFSRNKLIRVEKPNNNSLYVFSMLDDYGHAIKLELHVNLPELKIVDIKGKMSQVPYQYCIDAMMPKLESIRNCKIKRGITKYINETVVRQGCYHMGTILIESIHAAAESTFALFLHSKDMPYADVEQARKEWLSWMPSIKNSCIAL